MTSSYRRPFTSASSRLGTEGVGWLAITQFFYLTLALVIFFLNLLIRLASRSVVAIAIAVASVALATALTLFLPLCSSHLLPWRALVPTVWAARVAGSWSSASSTPDPFLSRSLSG